jgi:hypothetical protein
MNQNVGEGLWHLVSPFQGSFNFVHPLPRALPWAFLSCAFGAAIFGVSVTQGVALGYLALRLWRGIVIMRFHPCSKGNCSVTRMTMVAR